MCVPGSWDCATVRHLITEPGSALIFLLEKFITKYRLAFTTVCGITSLGSFFPKTGNSSGRKVVSFVLAPVPFWELGGNCRTHLLPSGRQGSSGHWVLMAGAEQGAWIRPSSEGKGWTWMPEGPEPLGRTQAMSVMASTDLSCRDNSVLNNLSHCQAREACWQQTVKSQVPCILLISHPKCHFPSRQGSGDSGSQHLQFTWLRITESMDILLLNLSVFTLETMSSFN